MKAIKITLLAGAIIAATGVAIAQPGPMLEMTRDQAAQRADQRFQRLDANRDGRVDADELRQVAEARLGQRRERMAERQGQMFERFDTDRNGQLSREEFSQRMAMRGNADGRRGMRGMRGRGPGGPGGRMGAGVLRGDGVVTAEEFRSRALARFDRMDANRDGRIAPDERRGGRDGRGRRGAPQQN